MARIIGLLAICITVLLSACAVQPANALKNPGDGSVGRPNAGMPPINGSIQSGLELEASRDVWRRIASEFRLGAIENPGIDAETRRFSNHPATLENASERALPFIYFIAKQVSDRRMPGEVALIPVIESGFHTNARSHRQALGIWQIMPQTGTRFGLASNWWYDGRQDIYASTHAALNYLEHLNGLFDGDWLLTLAAYNAGEGRVLRALAANRKKGKPTDFWHLRLPNETKRYIPRLLAVARIVKDPEAYGTSLTPVMNRPYLEVVDIGDQLDLTYAAELADVSPDLLYQYNPGFKRWATNPAGPHRLLLPAENARKLRMALLDLPPEQRIIWNRHQIQPGETLSHIARKYPVSIETLIDANRLRDSSRIRAGDYLLVPTPRNPAASLTAVTTAPDTNATKAQKVEYTVRSGDNLWVIARRFGVSHLKLASWNKLSPDDVLRPGRKLVVWT